MENTFKLDGYTFQEIKSNNTHRPFRVRCIETGEEKDGAISYNEAASLLIGQYQYTENVIKGNSKDFNYVRKVFRETLLGRKKSECDNLVEEQIVNRGRLKGCITSISSQDKFAIYQQYKTEYFYIKVLFENGIMHKCTKIEVSEI